MPKNDMAVMDDVRTTEIHHMQRVMSKNDRPNAGAVPREQIDRELSDWFAQGWKLFNTHYLGEMPEGFNILWILVR
jgi:hypothetical protein